MAAGFSVKDALNKNSKAGIDEFVEETEQALAEMKVGVKDDRSSYGT